MLERDEVIEYLRQIEFPINGKDNQPLREALFKNKITEIDKRLKSSFTKTAEKTYLLEQKISIIHRHNRITPIMVSESLVVSTDVREYLREIKFPVNSKIDNPALREKNYQQAIKEIALLLKKSKNPTEIRNLIEKKIRLISNHNLLNAREISEHFKKDTDPIEYLREIGIDPSIKVNPSILTQAHAMTLKQVNHDLIHSQNASERRVLLEKKERLIRNRNVLSFKELTEYSSKLKHSKP